MRKFLFKKLDRILLLCLLKVLSLSAGQADSQPNIVWIVSEDNSAQYLRLYSSYGAEMPTVERLASEGLVFENVFSNAPVCSVARSTLITGAYAPRLGAQFHRAMERMPMPENLRMFPAYLRAAGYYCSNNSKEDYNLIKTPGTWDESSTKATWRKRAAGQPFFHVQNFHSTHESRLHFNRAQFDASRGTLPQVPESALNPYLPKTNLGQFTHEWYLERHRILDEEIAAFLQQLKDDGLYEDTIIFYFADHGGVLPRSKGYLYESGLQVPLVVRVPGKWAHLFPACAGSRIEGFVNFIDFGPTILALAGLELPDSMDGRPFLGADVALNVLNSRDEAFAYADRFDEKYDMVRSLRKGNMKYVRSFQPFYPDMTYNEYRFKNLLYEEWGHLYRGGKLGIPSKQFFLPRTPEALYNLNTDPHELNNLAADSAYSSILQELRESMRQKLIGMPDLSFYPESFLMKEALVDVENFAEERADEVERFLAIADFSLYPFEEVQSLLSKALYSSNPWERYWALISCSVFGNKAEIFAGEIRRLAIEDPENLVRMRAAEFLGLTGSGDPVTPLIACLQDASSSAEALLVLNTMTVLHESPRAYRFPVNSAMTLKPKDKASRRMIQDRLAYLVQDLGKVTARESHIQEGRLKDNSIIILNTMKTMPKANAKILNSHESEEKKNLIIIYADDLGFGDLGCYGATGIPTPHLDQMAKEGLRFTNSYATAATCTPSRYSVLTGAYPWRNPRARILAGDAPMIIREKERTLPGTLQEAGYTTAVIGKWHIGLGNGSIDWNNAIHPCPTDVGFDQSYVMAATNDRVPCVFLNGNRIENLDPTDPLQVQYGGENPFPDMPTGKSNPELLSMLHSDAQHYDTIVNGVGRIGFCCGGKSAQWDDETMSDTFLNKAKSFITENRSNPFFLYYALHQPHVPRIPSPRFAGVTDKGPRGDVIVELDWCVGELLEHLKSEGLDKNTMVVFSSDNGPILDDGYVDEASERCGEHEIAGPLRGGKYSLFDGGARVPMIVWAPGRVKPGEHAALFSHVDFLASFAAMAGVEILEGDERDSLDLSAVLLGSGNGGREHLVTEGFGSKTVLRQGKWVYLPPHEGDPIFGGKGIETGNSLEPQLYDLDADIGQRKNLAAVYPEIVTTMHNLLEAIHGNTVPVGHLK